MDDKVGMGDDVYGGYMDINCNVVDSYDEWLRVVPRKELIVRVSERSREWVNIEGFRGCKYLMTNLVGRLKGRGVLVASIRVFETEEMVNEFIINHMMFKPFRCMKVCYVDGSINYELRGSF